MKIGIVSDSHGSTRAIDRMLSHPAAEGVTLWLHAGDITPDAEYLAMVTEGKAKVRYVAGNRMCSAASSSGSSAGKADSKRVRR